MKSSPTKGLQEGLTPAWKGLLVPVVEHVGDGGGVSTYAPDRS